MKKYPSIGQFRNVVQSLKLHFTYAGRDSDNRPIYDETRPLGKVDFHGTVKLHGTNAGISFKGDRPIQFQSREMVITPGSDNAGFAAFFSDESRLDVLSGIHDSLVDQFEISRDDEIILFGEWCGKGVQRGCAVHELEKRFVLFGIRHVWGDDDDEPTWLDISDIRNHDVEIYNILDYPTWTLTLDLNDIPAAQALLEKYTDQVEKECPFGKAFGITGIGEGIVWTAELDGKNFRFKSKGEKHSVTKSKNKVALAPEKLADIQQFVDYAVTENRLEQGIHQVFLDDVPTVKDTGRFIGWVSKDVAKEESDTMAESGLTTKEVSSAVAAKARQWYFDYLDRLIMS